MARHSFDRISVTASRPWRAFSRWRRRAAARLQAFVRTHVVDDVPHDYAEPPIEPRPLNAVERGFLFLIVAVVPAFWGIVIYLLMSYLAEPA
jgi:hypothetical protein